MKLETSKIRRGADMRRFFLGLVLIASISLTFLPLMVARADPIPQAGWSVRGGSDYSMEIIRANTVYQVTDPAAPVLNGLGVHGNR